MMRRVALVVAASALLLLAPPYAARERPRLAAVPDLMLWAWERPEDLRGLSADTGVAFLAQSIAIAGDRVDREPRRQPLRVSPGARLLAVTRIDTSRARPIAVGADRLLELAHMIAATSRLPRVVGVQVDFDARASERRFYRDLLAELRQSLEPGVPLSITALASWCMDDDWLGDLPIDEAVPMLFRMGPSERPFRAAAATGRFRAPACRGAVGTSLDEPVALNASVKRLYVFNPRPWSDEAIAEVRREVSR